MKYQSILKIFMPVVLVGFFTLIGGNKKLICEPVKPVEPVCSVPEDCDGLPHLDCLGEWQCVDGICLWSCHTNELPKCVQSGCSGEVCSEQEVYTTCIWKPEFECLKYTECGNFGENGECAFAKTEEYLKCMEQFNAECFSDADCKEGYYCKPLYKCGPYLKCIDSPGVCVPKEIESDTCFSDADCEPGEICEFQKPGFGEGLGCCPPNAICIPEIPPCEGKCVPAPKKCIVSGCSGEVCASEPVFTPCWYLEWFKCLEFTKCGNYGENGACAWKPTEEFLKCLEEVNKD